MARFAGTVTLGGRKRRVEVAGDPMRTVVQVDYLTVYDKKPFVAREKVAFEAAGEPVILTWRYPSLNRLECDITAGGTTTTLHGVADTGELVAPLDAATRRRLYVRSSGYLWVVAGLVALWWSYDGLRRGDYDPQMIFAAPVLVLGGATAAIFPHWAVEGSRATQRVALLAGVLLTLLLGSLFFRWFLSTFGPGAR